MNLDPIQQHHIENYGLNQAQPLASARSAAEERRKEYNEHCKRMEADPEYRMKWEQREKDMEEAKQRNYYY
jgi:hypothetical protein